MKHAALLILLCGCTSTTVSGPGGWQLKRISFLQRVEIPSLVVKTNGELVLTGYTNSGGNEALSAVTSAAVGAAIKSVKP